MAIPFLNHLDLLDVSEIQNAILHKTTSAVASDVEGKIIYDTGTDTIKYYNGSAWISVGGDNYVDGASLTGSTLTLTRTGSLADLTVDLSSLDDTVRTVAVDTDGDGTVDNTLADSEDLVLKKGSNITLEEAGGVVTISAANDQLTTEQVQDIVGAMFSGNTETRISANYQDGDGTIDLVVDDMTANDDVSNANLLDALANLESSGGAANENIVIGADSGDTIVITGNLQVSGTTTTIDSNTLSVGDHNIVLDRDNTTSGVVNGAGITIEGGTGDDATFTYNTTGPKFELKLGSSYEDLQVAQLIASSLDISGNVDVDGTLEADAITVNGSTLNSVIDGRITAREYKANFPSSATSAGDTITITHNLGTRDVIVQFYALVADIDGDANTPNVDQYEEVKLENIRATTNTITVAPNTGLVANALRVLIKEL